MRRQFQPSLTRLDSRLLCDASSVLGAAVDGMATAIFSPLEPAPHQPSNPDSGVSPCEEPFGSPTNPLPAGIDADALVQASAPSAPVADPTFPLAQLEVQAQFPLLYGDPPRGDEIAYVGDGRDAVLPTFPIDYD